MKRAMRAFVFAAVLVVGVCANAAQYPAGPGPWPQPPSEPS